MNLIEGVEDGVDVVLRSVQHKKTFIWTGIVWWTATDLEMTNIELAIIDDAQRVPQSWVSCREEAVDLGLEFRFLQKLLHTPIILISYSWQLLVAKLKLPARYLIEFLVIVLVDVFAVYFFREPIYLLLNRIASPPYRIRHFADSSFVDLCSEV